MTWTPNRRLALVAGVTLALDQLTKFAVLRFLGYAEERVVVEGFFKFVHCGNTGAAWSMFHNNNQLLTIIALLALLAEPRTLDELVEHGIVYRSGTRPPLFGTPVEKRTIEQHLDRLLANAVIEAVDGQYCRR